MTNLATGSASGVDVQLSARLSRQLSQLAFGVEPDGSALVEDLTNLAATLTSTVSGYAGLRLTIVHTGHPVQLTALLPTQPGQPVVTSLRLPLRPVSSAFEEGGWLIVWSTVRGSLVDLAADLAYVLHEALDGSVQGASSLVDLDVDLPPPTAASGVDGLHELATIHRAAGFLVEQGHDPESVHATLRSRASSDGVSTFAWADQLLRRR